MAPTPKTPSIILPEWTEFKKNIPPDYPYEKLLQTAAEAGFEYQLQQISAEGLADGSTLITFQVFIGRDGKLEPYDTISMHQHQSIGPVSLAARIQATSTLIYMFFGRVPGAPMAEPEQTVAVEDHPEGDIVLPGETKPDPEGGEYVEDSAPISRRAAAAAAKMPSLIDHLEPDGVPVFVDFDALPEQFTTEEIIGQFLVDINAAAVKFSSPEQLLALYTKNSDATDFLKELGTPADKAKFAAMLDDHKARLSEPAREVRIPGGKGASEAAPRRRRAA